MLVAIAALILAGLSLVVVEIVFIPGTTVVGFLGIVFLVLGVVFTFSTYGQVTGYYVLLGTGLSAAVILVLTFRSGMWSKFSLKTTSLGKVNEGQSSTLQVGQEGVARSALRPMGKGEFNEQTFEVTTLGDYIAPGTPIRIIHILSNQIVVEPAH